MGKRAQRSRRRTAAERIEHRQTRVAVIGSHREEFERERGAFSDMLKFGQFRRPTSPDSGEGDQ